HCRRGRHSNSERGKRTHRFDSSHLVNPFLSSRTKLGALLLVVRRTVTRRYETSQNRRSLPGVNCQFLDGLNYFLDALTQLSENKPSSRVLHCGNSTGRSIAKGGALDNINCPECV